MNVMRVMVFESPLTWNEFMKIFRRDAEPAFKKFKREKTLTRWSLTPTDDRAGVMVMEFPNKTAVNKYMKIASAVRQDATDEIGMQYWIYSGPVKASG